MQCAVIRHFPDVTAQYEFINRGQHKFPKNFCEELKKQVLLMSQLALSKEEKLFFAASCPYLNAAYLDFLEGYRYDPTEVIIEQEDEDLSVKVIGPWHRTILWEVPLLSLISELYYQLTSAQRVSDEQVIQLTREKMDLYHQLNVTVAEFGTRRRHSIDVHGLVMNTLMEYVDKGFVGTSNVHFAKVHNVKIIGTHAHEWFMYHGARFGFKSANYLALKHWVDVYQGDLGIALSDTYTTEVFFAQFGKLFAKLFDGVRHDSGDPIEFAEKTIAHYKSLGINPLHKTIIFSDGLNPEKVKNITLATQGKIGISFGIGTNLTNDVGVQPMNIVMKLTQVATEDMPWTSTVKLSDEPMKHTGDPNMIRLAKEMLGLQ